MCAHKPPLAARRRGLSFGKTTVMPWVTFTAADIKARLYEDEHEVYDAASGEDIDRVAVIVEQVCNRFRGAIRSNPNVVSMGAAGTLPSFCVFDAAVIGRTALIGLAPVQEGVTDPRRDEYNAAKDFLKSLSTMNVKAFEDDPAESGGDTSASSSYGGSDLLEF
jgi:hypothetical protein